MTSQNSVNNIIPNANFTVTGQTQSTGLNLGNTTMTSFVSGSWTPTITFGGSSTGNVYAFQTGFYTKINQCVYLLFFCGLSTKGTATGNLSISGLPYPSAVNYVGGAIVMHQFLTLPSNTINIIGVPSTSSTLDIYATFNNGSWTSLADTNCANDTDLRLSFSYFTN